RVPGVHGQVDRSRFLVLEEDLLPALPAVPGTEDAALRVRTVGVAEGRDVGEVRVLRVHEESADLARVLEAHGRPGLAGLGGLINAVAVGEVATDARLAGADVDDVRVRVGDVDGADRRDRFLVEEARPGAPAVRRL